MCGEKNGKRQFPRITFREGLVPDAESSCLGVTDIEVTDDHAKSFGGSTDNEEKHDIFHADPSIPSQVHNVRCVR